ncbi:Protein disulfide-isomerase [Cocos nucifera]|nr:Protein disulfide-isomerase [Cocos nucifera]
MWSRSISNTLGHHPRKDNLVSKIVKIKDNMAIMIVNEGEGISLKNTASENQGNSVYDILTHLLHQKEHASKTKESKISILAKEVGFQLLSNDFEVQVVDPLPSNENDQSTNMIKSDVTSPKDSTSELPKESAEPYVSMNDADHLDATNITALDEGKQPDAIDMETDIQQTQEAATYELETDKFSTKLDKEVKVDIGVFKSCDQKCCNQEELGSFTSHAENSFHLEQKSPYAMEYIKKEQVEHTDCRSNEAYSSEVLPKLTNIYSLDVSGNEVAENKKPMIISNADKLHDQRQPFFSSFFFSDGGYRLLRALTGGSKIPSLIILDPVRQQHYVFSEETEISYNSLLNFVDKFLSQSLTPYQHSALSTHSSRETPRPPFVNLDFHEADSIPRVTANTFCERVVGFESCETGKVVSFSNTENFLFAWKLDVLVLFSASWCGFCQRMELVMREVYRALKSFMNMPKTQAKNVDPMQIEDKKEDFALHGLPSILVMDCTLNDCSSFLKPMGEMELYPALWLFPAENKSAIYYEGDMSVIDIMEFLASRGSNSHYLNRNKGFLWTHAWKRSMNRATLHDVSVHKQAHYAEDQHKQCFLHTEVGGNVDHPIESHASGNFHDKYKHVDVASILAATDKLIDAFPFDNSTVLIVMADQKQGFQGMITNKRISWDVFKELDKDLEPLKQAPLFYGGPVMAHRMPLVSLTRKEVEGYTKVVTGIYFGNPVATSLIIEQIKSGDHSALDYWFFLGYSSWAYDQLFDELAGGAWNLSKSPIEYLDWPDS